MKPLQGIRVVDFSRVLAGPMATQILAELGAEVIKVERPRSGDESRQFEPRYPTGQSGYYFAFNRSKRSVALELQSAKGREAARRLAAEADVLVENFLPGRMEKYGLGYEALSALNPALVYVSNTGFGQTGPHRDRKGYDTVFQALSGIMHLTGHPGGPPAKVGVPIADLTSGLWIALAAMSGLIGRGANGRGCHVDVAMLDVEVSLLTIAAARYFALGEDPQRVGTEHLGRVPSAAFECRDGRWIQISGSDQHWKAICRVLGLEALGQDTDLATNAGRVAQRERVMAALSHAIAAWNREPLAAELRQAGVPVGEVNTVAEILNDPQIVARGMVGAFAHPEVGAVKALRTPVYFKGFDQPDMQTPPELGADTEDVLKRCAGFTDAELKALREEGVI